MKIAVANCLPTKKTYDRMEKVSILALSFDPSRVFLKGLEKDSLRLKRQAMFVRPLYKKKARFKDLIWFLIDFYIHPFQSLWACLVFVFLFLFCLCVFAFFWLCFIQINSPPPQGQIAQLVERRHVNRHVGSNPTLVNSLFNPQNQINSNQRFLRQTSFWCNNFFVQCRIAMPFNQSSVHLHLSIFSKVHEYVLKRPLHLIVHSQIASPIHQQRLMPDNAATICYI